MVQYMEVGASANATWFTFTNANLHLKTGLQKDCWLPIDQLR